MNYKITSKHFLFLILGVSSISITAYSSIFIKEGGRDSWIYGLISCLLCIILFTATISKLNKLNFESIDILFKKLLGKFFGSILLFLFSIWIFITAIESVSSNAVSINTNYFLETPILFCLIFLLVPITYLLTRNFDTMVILSLIIVSITLIGYIILDILTLQYWHLKNLLPIFQNGFSINNLRPLLFTFGSTASVALVLPFLPYVAKSKNIKRHTIIALIISTLLIVFSLISPVASFGPYRASNIYFPDFVAAQRVQIASFIEFGEFFYIYKSVTGWLLKYVISYFAIYTIYQNKIKNIKVFAICFTIAVFVFSYLLTKNSIMYFYLLPYYNYISLILGYGPIIILLFSSLFYKD